MIRKKAKKGKPRVKKADKTKDGAKRGKQEELHPVEVRKDLSKLVEAHAEKLAQAVIGEGEKGQLAPVKYLFEMANIFPSPTDGSVASAEEESLAKTLLDRLGIPTSPVVADEYEKDEFVTIAAAKQVADEKKESAEDVKPESAKLEAGEEESAEVPAGCA